MMRLFLSGVLTLGLLSSFGQTPPSSPTFPNIVYILADDLGYGDLGCYGQGRIQTPNIDRLAQEGMRFLHHYAGSTVCAPSRCTLMTGQHTGHADIRGNNDNDAGIYSQTVTVAEILKKAGYHTAMIGKWGIGLENTPGNPNQQGFDFYYGYLDQILAHNYYPEFLLRNGQKEYLNNEVTYVDSSHWSKGKGSYAVKKVDYSHDLFIKEALQYIDNQQNAPFFLYLPLTIPHNNGEAPKGERQEVPDLGLYTDRPYLTEAPAPIRQETKGYAAMITRLDKDVGQIMKRLKDRKMDNNTIVIFSSDNGPMPYHHQFTAFFSSNAQFSGYKMDLLEGGIRVPLIVRWPERVSAGSVSSHPSAFWDFLPTVADLVGQEYPAGVDGISFLPELMGKQQPKHEHLYWEYQNLQAVRMGPWKGIRTYPAKASPSVIQLYNISEDISERINVADQHPDIVGQIASIMEQEHKYSSRYPFEGELNPNK
ncbi:arylsulfatase [Tunicatimonas pelagia]|uniref:arylsulfatase n=1 Tax=Tunicatimonas pelagia TaxID=931531 RepID=UPI0026650E24|nr:arylsulfatase [Tunicatimonas pelagia]WKN44881.1 arylsulfatase [Tunicatimonas pelagia]